MPRHVAKGRYYKFSRKNADREIGACIPRNRALQLVLRGKGVCTPAASDAKSLAKDVVPGAAEWDGAHQKNFFPHYHAGFNHDLGHIFYGERDYRRGEMQNKPEASRR